MRGILRDAELVELWLDFGRLDGGQLDCWLEGFLRFDVFLFFAASAVGSDARAVSAVGSADSSLVAGLTDFEASGLPP